MARWPLALILLGSCGGQAVRGPDAGSPDAALVQEDADCIDISPSQFQTSCSRQADCTLIAYGRFCHSDTDPAKTTGVECNGAINVASQAQYEKLLVGYPDRDWCRTSFGVGPIVFPETSRPEGSTC